MIKFFRNIRQRLITENRFTKYLLYAIGEIVLVVIGILIALQINNWNEQRKNAIEEQTVLKSLYENLSLAKRQSEVLITEENTLKHRLIRILGIDPTSDDFANRAIPDSIFKWAVWDLQSDQPTFNAYNNLKNTNKLSLIRNDAIHVQFTELEFRQNKLNDILEDRLSVHQIRIDDILENEINFIPLVKANIPNIRIDQEVPNNYYQVLEDQRVRNLRGMKLTFTQDVLNYRIRLDKAMADLIDIIKKELRLAQEVHEVE